MKPSACSLVARSQSGTTLVETLVSIALAAMAIAGTVKGYVLAANRSEWSAYSLAAQSLANQQMEQTRAAKWDTLAYPMVDQLVSSNFPIVTNVMDVPISGTNIVYATNYTTITTVSTSPPLKMIRVVSIWPFINHGVYSNVVIAYRAPDQ